MTNLHYSLNHGGWYPYPKLSSSQSCSFWRPSILGSKFEDVQKLQQSNYSSGNHRHYVHWNLLLHQSYTGLGRWPRWQKTCLESMRTWVQAPEFIIKKQEKQWWWWWVVLAATAVACVFNPGGRDRQILGAYWLARSPTWRALLQ